MDFEMPVLRNDEKAVLGLRALYEKRGYTLFRMGSFEEYDLYMQNKSFLADDDIITFNSKDGRLMALKPDVTLSIVKNVAPGQQRRIYYSENVFRRSRQTGEFREINQMGLEFIGGEKAQSDIEVLELASASLAAIGNSALDVSHMEFIEEMLSVFDDSAQRENAFAALRNKSPHLMREASLSAGVEPKYIGRLEALCELSGPFFETLPGARAIAAPSAQKPLDELEAIFSELAERGVDTQVRLDFSIHGDADYYNGLIFQGFVENAAHPVLYGGRYDNLLKRFGKDQGATGFALYLDFLGRSLADKDASSANAAHSDWLNIALPKGRLGNAVYQLFEQAGVSCEGVLSESRKLVFENSEKKVRIFLVKPSDVDIYVEHGAADIGVAGKDTLLENGADVLELVDLKLSSCRFALAGKQGFVEDPAVPLRVATKYPVFTRRYYASLSREVEIIKLHGSIELAPLLELSDVILDIVETGATIKENKLEIIAELAPSSARLIANRAAYQFKFDRIRQLSERLGELI